MAQSGLDLFADKLDNFKDVRDILKHLKANHIKLEREASANTSGSASIVFFDPNGNTILIDKHL
ncbi:MAG: VOC family protein [Polaribacter sp.]|uniref:VOC family protein n=1 Tax=Polaribacter sp. TaxID=1920175 RepID=UPI0032197360